MNPDVLRYYSQLRRNPGATGEACLSCARALALWDALEARGWVRIHCEPEQECYEDVYGCLPGICDHPTDRQIEHAREELYRTINREGLWWYAFEYRDEGGEWQHGASLGMVIGDLDLAEKAGLASECLSERDAYADKVATFEAESLAQRATFAGVQS